MFGDDARSLSIIDEIQKSRVAPFTQKGLKELQCQKAQDIQFEAKVKESRCSGFFFV